MGAIDSATAWEVLQRAQRIRAADDRICRGLDDKDFFGIHYPVLGQEVVSAAIGAHFRKGDALVSNYRMLGDAVSLGIPPMAIFAETMGRACGLSGGKGGPMHLAAPEHGLLATTGIVGGGLPIAVGAALGCQLRGDGSIAIVTFGDGATSIGAFHEAMSVAGAWRLPILFVCINNHFLLHTRLERVAAVTELSAKAEGYGMIGTRHPLGDPFGTMALIGQTMASIRSGEGPAMLEFWGDRRHPHMHGSDVSYMPQHCLDRDTSDDPLTVLRSRLLRTHAGKIQAFEDRISEEMDAAYRKALAAPPPDPQVGMADRYLNPMEWPR